MMSTENATDNKIVDEAGVLHASFPTISIDGKALLDSKGNRFMINGVALQPGKGITDYNYPLSDSNFDYTKSVVLPLLQNLNVNVVRVYTIDVNASHDLTMDLLAQNGIYVMLEIETPSICVDTLKPEYKYELYMRGIQVVDIFQKYPNTLAFSVGNETENPGLIYSITQDVKKAIVIQENIATALKSFMRDMKAYIVTKGYRSIPVGVVLRDVFQNAVVPSGLIGTDVCAIYYASGTDVDSRADFVGLNTYRYVTAENPANDPLTTYDSIANDWSGMPIPIIFSEIGAIAGDQTWPRDWAIIEQMYTEQLLSDNFSGQVAFSFFNEENNLGLYVQQPNHKGNLQSTLLGGVDKLAAQFELVKGQKVALPTVNPTTIAAPSNFQPPLLAAFVPPNVSVTIENYATVELKVIQGGALMAILPPAISNSIPSITSDVLVNTINDLDLYLLQPVENAPWLMSCNITASVLAGLIGGETINNTNWGQACNITS